MQKNATFAMLKREKHLFDMNKTLHILALSALMLAAPVGLMAEELYEGPETEVTEMKMVVLGVNVRVLGANGETLNVFNLAGVQVASYRIDSSDKTVNLNKLGKGCYILKVGNIARKVSIR